MRHWLQPEKKQIPPPSLTRPPARALVSSRFKWQKKILTRGLSAEAKAAQAAGKSNTVAMVADQLRTVYKVAAAGAKYDDIMSDLEKLPECK